AVAVEVGARDGRLLDDVGDAVTVDVDRGGRDLLDDVGDAVTVDVDRGRGDLLDDVGAAVAVDVDRGGRGGGHRVGLAAPVDVDDVDRRLLDRCRLVLLLRLLLLRHRRSQSCAARPGNGPLPSASQQTATQDRREVERAQEAGPGVADGGDRVHDAGRSAD